MTQLLNGAALAGMVGDPRSPYWVRWAATIVYGPDLGKGQRIPISRRLPTRDTASTHHDTMSSSCGAMTPSHAYVEPGRAGTAPPDRRR
jgi:hypothetical protein